MITIKVIPVAKNLQENLDFHRSILAQVSDKNNYEVISPEDEPSENSRITISLPDNCLVLGKDWDKYIQHALDNDLPKYNDPDGKTIYLTTWNRYVIRR